MEKYRQGMESGDKESEGSGGEGMTRRGWLVAIGAGAAAAGVCLNDAINPHYKISPRLLQYFQRSDENRWMNCKRESDEDLEIRIQILDDAIKESRERKFIPISKPQDFDKMRRNPMGYWELANDIDLKGIDFEPIGEENKHFYGIFNGNEHVIRNLTFNQLSHCYFGLFGFTETDSIIHNLFVENVNITGDSELGVLAAFNLGALYNCHINTCNLNGRSVTGGLIGRNVGKRIFMGNDYSGLILNCSARNVFIENCAYGGGFVGYNDSGALINPFFRGKIGKEAAKAGIMGVLIGSNRDGGYVVNPDAEAVLNGETFRRLIGYEEHSEDNLVRYYEKKMIGG